ncbi:MAG: peptide deformylase [Rhabdochlamydiaceae bacterium]|nr:peptide deformylase [Rhabdochlamydiaceae bacterium]
MFLSQASAFSENIKIVTVDSLEKEVLRQKTEEIYEDELPLAKEIAEKLFAALQPLLPAAGLAAPQIGISKSVFIFSFDRDPKNFEVVINPQFVPMSDELIEGWESCFSVLLQMAKVPRYQTIKATFLNLNGEKVEKVLEGFAAKVFQHEYDHLQGVENIDRKDSLVKSFESREELIAYLQEVKKEDSTRYVKPIQTEKNL